MELKILVSSSGIKSDKISSELGLLLINSCARIFSTSNCTFYYCTVSKTIRNWFTFHINIELIYTR